MRRCLSASFLITRAIVLIVVLTPYALVIHEVQ